jgi:hypothetical protein
MREWIYALAPVGLATYFLLRPQELGALLRWFANVAQ